MASEAMCRGFKSLQARQSGPLAQLVEQLTLNQRVVGSIPTRPTTLERRLRVFRKTENRWVYSGSTFRRSLDQIVKVLNTPKLPPIFKLARHSVG